MPAAPPRRRVPPSAVNLSDPVVRRLAHLIVKEEADPQLGSREELVDLRYRLMRDTGKHTWRVCLSCRRPFDSARVPSATYCAQCYSPESVE